VSTQAPRISFHPGIASRSDATVPGALVDSASAIDVQELERQVEYIVDECFFTVGQVVGMRTTVDYEAVIWWRDHYRAKFLSAMKAFGNRWRQDRANVTSVAIMLAERAVRYSEGKPSIDAGAARRAAADVERHCEIHARRAARRRGLDPSDAAATRIAGYWCNF
jgi:tetrahydromethanopterin S-methyltransferase subunit G